MISEFEWRINVAVENGKLVDEDLKLDYTKLANIPSINGKPLVGNVDEKDPTVEVMPASDIDALWDKSFNS